MISPYEDTAKVIPYYPTVLDIETEQTEGHIIGLGMAFADHTEAIVYEQFEDWDEWFSYYLKLYRKSTVPIRKRLRTIYAHYGARFDWLHFVRWCITRDLATDLRCVQSGSMVHGINVKLRIAGERITLRLRDSYRLLPQSLKKITNTFALAQPKIDLAGVMPETLKRDNPVLFWEYLRVDVLSLQETLYKFWTMIISIIGFIGELPMTLPSLAMRLFRMTLDESIFIPKHETLKEHERKSYTGGRTECFKPGIYDAVDIYDVNSEYPSVMLSGIFPSSYVGAWTSQYNGEHGIYHIRFNQTNRVRYPVLGIIEDDAYHFRYTGDGWYAQPEIENLLRVGGDIEVIDGYKYYEMSNLFHSFIDRWYSIRLAAQRSNNEALAYVCKILMNSLYGKFGQREEGYSMQIWGDEEYQRQLEKQTPFRDIGDAVLVEEHRPNETTFTGIASYVTAQARVLLYSYIERAQDLGNEVIYCDTDSIHCVGGFPMETGDGLGMLKHEYSGGAMYASKKFYAQLNPYKIKAKGIGSRIPDTQNPGNYLALTDVLTPEIFRDIVLNNRAVPIEFEVLPSPLEVMSGKRAPAVSFTRSRTVRRNS